METSMKLALLLGVVSIVSAPVGAQSAAGNTSPMQGLERSSERGAARLERTFDLNKDGRVTRDELNRTIGARFVAATHHAPTMTPDQFAAARANEFRPYNEAMFKRLDWNGDGKLSLVEYSAPQRVRFVGLDRNGVGYVSCAAGDNRGTARGGLAGFCNENDLNMDGRVTRTELDQAIAKRFAQATGGGQAMTIAQFVTSEQQRFAVSNARLFRRLDRDGDGVLTVQEYGGVELELFAQLDKNKDGTASAGELHARIARAPRGERRASN